MREREASLEEREASLEEREASLDQKELRLKKATTKELETKQNLQAAEEVSAILLFSPSFTISLCRAGHYLCHYVLLGLCHVFCHLVSGYD